MSAIPGKATEYSAPPHRPRADGRDPVPGWSHLPGMEAARSILRKRPGILTPAVVPAAAGDSGLRLSRHRLCRECGARAQASADSPRTRRRAGRGRRSGLRLSRHRLCRECGARAQASADSPRTRRRAGRGRRFGASPLAPPALPGVRRPSSSLRGLPAHAPSCRPRPAIRGFASRATGPAGSVAPDLKPPQGPRAGTRPPSPRS